MFWVPWLLFQDASLGRILIVLVKWELSTKERVQNDSKTPDVNLFTSIFFALEHLGSTVTYSATPRLQIARFALIFSCESKIYQLDVLMLVQKDIFELQVSVNAGFLVNIGDGAD
jgi:hypothetical protein